MFPRAPVVNQGMTPVQMANRGYQPSYAYPNNPMAGVNRGFPQGYAYQQPYIQPTPTIPSVPSIPQSQQIPKVLPHSESETVKVKTSFRIPADKKQYYQAIFTLINQIEILEGFLSDSLDGNEEIEAKLNFLGKQLRKAVSAVRMTQQQLEQFAESCSVPCAYAINRLNEAPSRATSNPQLSQSDIGTIYMKIGSSFTVLSDYCDIGQSLNQDYLMLITELKTMFKNVGIYNGDVRKYTKKWKNTFKELPMNELPDGNLTARLKADIIQWRNASMHN